MSRYQTINEEGGKKKNYIDADGPQQSPGRWKDMVHKNRLNLKKLS